MQVVLALVAQKTAMLGKKNMEVCCCLSNKTSRHLMKAVMMTMERSNGHDQTCNN